MIDECVQFFKQNCPNLYNSLKRNTLLHYFYYLPSKMYMNGRKKAIQKHGYEVIEMVYRISKELKIDIWIDGGTLLGYVREGALMKHDYDIDFALYSLDDVKRDYFLAVMQERGCTLVRGVANGKIHYTDSLEYKGVIFDFNYYFLGRACSYYYEQDTNREHGTKVVLGKTGDCKMTYIYGYDIYKCIITDDGIEDGKFSNGCPCIVPKRPVKRIEEIYGSNWETPIVQDYDWRRDRVFEFLGFHGEVTGWKIK